MTLFLILVFILAAATLTAHAVTGGPLFSLRAAGQLGKAIVYSTWKGIEYVRKYVVPSNPNSAAQQATRNVFRSLNNMWNRSSTYFRAAWGYVASGRPFTDRNAFFGDNISAMVGGGVADANLNNMIFSRGAGNALPPSTVVNSDAGGQALQAVVTAPTAPAGWTLVAAITACVLQGDPSPAIIRTVLEDRSVAPSPITNSIATGAAGTYVTASWLEWTDPAGATKVSASSTAEAVVIA